MIVKLFSWTLEIGAVPLHLLLYTSGAVNWWLVGYGYIALLLRAALKIAWPTGPVDEFSFSFIPRSVLMSNEENR